jgi:hypothetical protein
MSPAAIAHSVQQQLSKYAYIFPSVCFSLSISFKLMFGQNNPLAMPQRPYRNSRVIDIIQDLYFTGTNSLATQLVALFPESQDSSGATRHEVPITMVALVATAVSPLDCMLLKQH